MAKGSRLMLDPVARRYARSGRSGALLAPPFPPLASLRSPEPYGIKNGLRVYGKLNLILWDKKSFFDCNKVSKKRISKNFNAHLYFVIEDLSRN